MGIGSILGRREATENFLRNTGEFTITLPALPRPSLNELRKQYPGITSIERDTSPETPVTLNLATVLKRGERSIGGTEYERRLGPKQNVLLGFQHWQWLLAHQDEFPALKALLGKVYIDFPGIVVRDGEGDRVVPYCGQDDTRWRGSWDWLGSSFRDRGRVAAVRE